jgi:hypothetical protein
MKKYLSLIACMAISFLILAGCENNSNSILSDGKGSTLNMQSHSDDGTDWKPTAYKTINNFDGVNMTVKKGTVSSTKLTLVFKNNSRSQCIYGEDFSLEKKINGEWYQVPVTIKGNYGFNSIGYNLASGDEKEKAMDWGWLYGNLNRGEYRIVKSILDFRAAGNYDTYNLAAEFTISNTK